MKNKTGLFTFVVVLTILGFLTYEHFSTFEKSGNYLDQITDVFWVDKHIVKNNHPHYSTIGKITIVEPSLVKILFDNSNGFGKWNNGERIWEIPESFEYESFVQITQSFVVHCKASSNDVIVVDILEVDAINIEEDTITLNHYTGIIENSQNCVHPDIIADSINDPSFSIYK